MHKYMRVHNNFKSENLIIEKNVGRINVARKRFNMERMRFFLVLYDFLQLFMN